MYHKSRKLEDQRQRTMEIFVDVDTSFKNKKIGRQHIHAILDRSGSMSGKTGDVLNGFQCLENRRCFKWITKSSG